MAFGGLKENFSWNWQASLWSSVYLMVNLFWVELYSSLSVRAFFFFLQYFKNICFLNFIDVQLIYNVVLIYDVYLSMFDIIIVVQYLCETDSLLWQLALLLKQESLPSSPFLQLGFRQIWYLSIVLDPGESLELLLFIWKCLIAICLKIQKNLTS